MSKYVQLMFADGFYEFPASIIAHNRALYYADTEHPHQVVSKEWRDTYDTEFGIAMEDDWELWDWMQNEMNFEEIAPHLRKFKDRAGKSLENQYKDLIHQDFKLVDHN